MATIITDPSEAFSILSKYFIKGRKKPIVRDEYTLTPDGVDYDAYVMSTKVLKVTIPIKFNHVRRFYVMKCRLPTLDGVPNVVDETFYASHNKLKNLIGGPREVGDDYYVSDNPLTSLEGAPITCHGRLNLDYREIPLLRILGIRSLKEVNFNGRYDYGLCQLINDLIGMINDGEMSRKQAIWTCQKKLIDVDHDQIAKW
jgi:hypothetical protein